MNSYYTIHVTELYSPWNKWVSGWLAEWGWWVTKWIREWMCELRVTERVRDWLTKWVTDWASEPVSHSVCFDVSQPGVHESVVEWVCDLIRTNISQSHAVSWSASEPVKVISGRYNVFVCTICRSEKRERNEIMKRDCGKRGAICHKNAVEEECCPGYKCEWYKRSHYYCE